jgi:hypothetical protein
MYQMYERVGFFSQLGILPQEAAAASPAGTALRTLEPSTSAVRMMSLPRSLFPTMETDIHEASDKTS